ncbi:alanine--tRNA ligase, cytoplasmic-like [Clavelina lepadiformis]|uniref:alanine--tRNA ligase, cytoplasmic-like n=1 Tax=Clavelina lepadiformis TaxID=159417 RepID=UPI0040413195
MTLLVRFPRQCVLGAFGQFYQIPPSSIVPPACRFSQHSSKDIRELFINYYRDKHQHTQVPSSKVFSPDDNSLLFVNAGMNQFKPVLLGNEAAYKRINFIKRAVNSQKCIRAGGKHNDLEDVGVDVCHHTFFEMLGSWSFGDYFKKDACKMAWSLLADVFHLSKDKLYVTYFSGCEEIGLEADLETKEIWNSIGVNEDRILPFGIKDNFWEMGDSGPCGPCTEIHYDQNPDLRYAPEEVNKPGSDVIEIWNLVFMQYNRLGKNELIPLKKCHVDAGMGLERITAVLQGKVSNYDTDLFHPIISALENLSKCRPYAGHVGEEDLDGTDAAYRIVSDHIRMLTIAISDGIHPGPRGRDLIVRQVLRRAVMAGVEKLGIENMFLHKLVPVVIESLKPAFPDLESSKELIVSIINKAEKSFYDMLAYGDKLITKTVSSMPVSQTAFPTDVAWQLLSYYGYPQDTLMLKLKGYDMSVNMQEILKFSKLKNPESIHLDRQRKAFNVKSIIQILSAENIAKTEEILNTKLNENARAGAIHEPLSCRILAILSDTDKNTEATDKLSEGYFLVLDKSYFFIPNADKLEDVGVIVYKGKNYVIDEVLHVQGWLLHRLNCISTKDSLDKFITGDEVEIHTTGKQWLPYFRAYSASCLVKHVLPKVCPNSSIQKVKVGKDKIKLEIGGSLDTGAVMKVQDAINSVIFNKHSEGFLNSKAQDSHKQLKGDKRVLQLKDIEKVLTIKCKHQGQGRTVIHFVCGSRADSSTKLSEHMNIKMQNILKNYDRLSSKSSKIVELEELLLTVGQLTFDINQAEMSVFEKANYRNKLSQISSRLRTMRRRLKRQLSSASGY